jgi:hypothetical protein
MKIVIGVDPGASAGLAVIVEDALELVMQGTPKEVLQALQARLNQHRQDDVIVACERFIQLPSGRGRPMTHQPEAQMMVGRVEELCALYGRKVLMQAPVDAHAIGSNALLQKVGMWTTPAHVMQPDAKDANMAVRHALLALARYHATTFDRVMYGPSSA